MLTGVFLKISPAIPKKKKKKKKGWGAKAVMGFLDSGALSSDRVKNSDLADETPNSGKLL